MLMDEVHETLQRLLIDENKIVTYKTASRLLNIHANEAKFFLENFFNIYRTELGLDANYLIIGIYQDGDGYECIRSVIVSEEDLEGVKSSFSNLTSSHIYCVYKGNLVDKCSLYTVDYAPSEELVVNSLSAIVNLNVKTVSGKNLKHPTSYDVQEKNKPTSTNAHILEKNEQPKPSPRNSKSPDIFSLFQKKGDSKKCTVIKTEPESPKDESSGFEERAKVSDVKYLFSRQFERNASKPLVKVDDVCQVGPSITSSLAEKPTAEKIEEKRPPCKRAKKSVKQQNGDSDFDSLKPKKMKHKRVMTFSDSDSDSDSETADDKLLGSLPSAEAPLLKCVVEDDDDEIIPPTPQVSGSKRKWKMVTKTFQDEDGFFVTKKTKEYVTSSSEENDEELNAAKPLSSLPSKAFSNKKASVSKKQSSLTSFFKQK